MGSNHAVVIVGGGPTGLMLAGELTLAGVNAVIIERRANQKLEGSRAKGIHSRVIEVLDQRGIAERFLAEGKTMQIQHFGGAVLDISDFPTRHNYGLAIGQQKIEEILAAWADELGVPIMRNTEVVGFTQDEGGVDIKLSNGTRLRSQYLVGCDGGRSLIRKIAGIDFPGIKASTSWIIAEVKLREEPEIGVRAEGGGIGVINNEGDERIYQIVLQEKQVEHDRDATLEDLRTALTAAYGTDYGVHDPVSISRFTDASRQAATYRNGRVLLAGDAAHIHPPQGGQGLGTGLQDAVSLGWKLAQVVNGVSPATLLDTYHDERHPVGARMLRLTASLVALGSPDARHQALRDILAEPLSMEAPRKHIAGLVSGLDIRYGDSDGHPLIGRRMPDLDVKIDGRQTRIFNLLHKAEPFLMSFNGNESFDISPWAKRVHMFQAEYDGAWEVPVVGSITAPRAVLVRPDGYVAWAGNLNDPELPRALDTWFGGAIELHLKDVPASIQDRV